MRESREFISPDEAQEYIDQGLKDIQEMNGVCFVAESKGTVVGFVQGIIDAHNGQVMHILGHNPSIDGWIGLLIVDLDFRNQGIGRRLIKNIKQYFTKNGCKTMRLKVMVDNRDTVHMYEKLGFRKKEIEMVYSLEL
jgi:ribosomal protein S18 acetylase RimI-like enzyme